MKIIVVDNSPVDRRLISDALHPVLDKFPESYVVEFSTTDDALREISKNRVALIVTDVNLHDEYADTGGVTLVQKVHHELKKEYPIILISEQDSAEISLKRAAEICNVRIWQKPDILDGWEGLTELAMNVVSETRVESRIRHLEDSTGELHEKMDLLTGKVDSLTVNLEYYMTADDRIWSRLVSMLMPEKVTKWARRATQIEKKEKTYAE